jgi:Rps23 Pro-64 3,4-dihydroxylase Tpa1-like proline 4-hydroxylase
MDNYSREKKINPDLLQEINQYNNVLLHFGEWVKDADNLRTKFVNAEPFEHIVIDGFLDRNFAEQLHEVFPENYDTWYKYENPIELKYSFDNILLLDSCIQHYFHYLCADTFVNIMRRLTGIQDITFDEYLHGAGLHCHPRHGKLNIHLDYEKHPITGKERKINVILFLSKGWDSAWNGQNELWDKKAENCIVKTDVVFNRAIIFKTNDISFHGLPNRITCPEGHFRKTLAFYYVSPLSSIKPEDEYRKKAKYVITDKDEMDNPALKKLCAIRANRRLTKEDLEDF